MLQSVSRIVALFNLACGISAYTISNEWRVVNGTDALPGKYPFMVSYQKFNRHKCGATILNENWVLTAAHCVYRDTAMDVSILFGTTDLYNGGNRNQVSQLILHEYYDQFMIQNDIALVKVETPFLWNNVTSPVILPTQNQETPGGSPATLTGWGLPYTGGSVMQMLQEVNYWIVSDQECRDAHKFYPVFDTNICAFYPGGGKGQCSGDSGGPLFVDGIQVGVVSWSKKPCTIAPYPGVFTEISAYIDWIHRHTSDK